MWKCHFSVLPDNSDPRVGLAAMILTPDYSYIKVVGIKRSSSNENPMLVRYSELTLRKFKV